MLSVAQPLCSGQYLENNSVGQHGLTAPLFAHNTASTTPQHPGDGAMAKKRQAQKVARKTGAAAKARPSAELSAVIDDLVIGNRILYVQDVVDGYGHISARHPQPPDRFLMSRARAPGLVVPSDIMEFGLDGELIRPDPRPIYSERFIHSEAYRARPDVNAVVHSHSPTVVPFSVTQVPLRPIRAPFP